MTPAAEGLSSGRQLTMSDALTADTDTQDQSTDNHLRHRVRGGNDDGSNSEAEPVSTGSSVLRGCILTRYRR